MISGHDRDEMEEMGNIVSSGIYHVNIETIIVCPESLVD